MATKTTGWSCTHATSIVSETDTTKTIRVTSYWQNNGWTYDINYVSSWVYCNGESHQVKNSGSVNAPANHGTYSMGYHDFVIDKGTNQQNVSCYAKITSNSSYVSGTKSSSATSVSVSAKTSYTVSYNANGGSGSLSNQTKWYDTNLTLSSAKPTRTGYTFSKWNTKSDGSGTSYNPGAVYTNNSNLTLYAIWTANTYTVTYNANEGTGAPGNQTKTYGVNLTLSTTIPTRTNYNFLGWATSANGGVVYAAGATYTNNSAVTLYAVWELAYVKPRINNFTAQRCDSSGNAIEDGTYIKVNFDWSTDKDITAAVFEWKIQGDDSWSIISINVSGTSGTIDQIISSETRFDNETSYIVRVYLSDGTTIDESNTTYSLQVSIGTIKYPIDILCDGLGVAFNKVAELEDVADFAFTVKLGGGLIPIFLEAETDLDNVRTPNFYTGENVTNFNYTNCPLLSGTFYLEVVSMGSEGQVRQKITSCNKNGAVTYERFYYQGTWGKWHNASSGVVSIVTAGEDLNDYTTSGTYSFSSSTTPTNAPDGVANGWLTVIASSTTTLKQIWYRTGTANVSDFETYTRTCNGGTWGKWRRYSIEPVVLFTGSSADTITLSETSANFKYLEIFFTDNNGRGHGYTKMMLPSSAPIHLSLIEDSGATTTFVRRSSYTVSGTSMVPDLTCSGYIKFSGTALSHTSGSNYIKITKVLGHI